MKFHIPYENFTARGYVFNANTLPFFLSTTRDTKMHKTINTHHAPVATNVGQGRDR